MLYKKYPELSLSSLYLSNQVTSHRTAAIEDLRLKLPKLELSKFDGEHHHQLARVLEKVSNCI